MTITAPEATLADGTSASVAHIPALWDWIDAITTEVNALNVGGGEGEAGIINVAKSGGDYDTIAAGLRDVDRVVFPGDYAENVTDAVAGLWCLDTKLGTSGVVTISEADGPYHTIVEIAQTTRVLVRLSNATGTWAGGSSDGMTVWLSSSGEM